MLIIQRHLPNIEYNVTPQEKKQITLHHTVSSGTPEAVRDWFMADKGGSKVATEYVVGLDGKTLELFPPQYWAYDLGISKQQLDKNNIGIEIVNEGWLTQNKYEVKRNFYWNGGKTLYKRGEPYYKAWRGFEFWATYPEEQFKAVVELVRYLCDMFNIPKKVITDYQYYPDLMASYTGVLSHHNQRKDKTDVSVAFDLERFQRELLMERKANVSTN